MGLNQEVSIYTHVPNFAAGRSRAYPCTDPTKGVGGDDLCYLLLCRSHDKVILQRAAASPAYRQNKNRELDYKNHFNDLQVLIKSSETVVCI